MESNDSPEIPDRGETSDIPGLPSGAEDKTLNSCGKQLLNMCVALDLWIMNGVCNGHPQSRYTYISDTGNCVNEYFLVTDDLFALVQRCCQLHVSERLSQTICL